MFQVIQFVTFSSPNVEGPQLVSRWYLNQLCRAKFQRLRRCVFLRRHRWLAWIAGWHGWHGNLRTVRFSSKNIYDYIRSSWLYRYKYLNIYWVFCFTKDCLLLYYPVVGPNPGTKQIQGGYQYLRFAKFHVLNVSHFPKLKIMGRYLGPRIKHSLAAKTTVSQIQKSWSIKHLQMLELPIATGNSQW